MTQIDQTPHFRAGERQHNRMTRDDWIGAIAFIAMMLAICIV